MARNNRTRTALAAVAVLAATAIPATGAVANATPTEFPNVDAYPAVNLPDYYVTAAHPSGARWSFSTPSGIECSASMIADLGIYCWGALGADDDSDQVWASLEKAGRFSTAEQGGSDSGTLLPVGSKIETPSGMVCAVPTAQELACRAQKPDSWPDTPSPGARLQEYGVHGFVLEPSGSWAF
ncbi:hypothetical protein M1247_32050 [Mycobacterium sp. 21AC1]|uniref:hypothetical protein n=1 Tax=[Mycobacterium] appelbergii TaxID=2939269 RepID=UPI0029394C1B|nr:hypothetical protein [Mycobacterium sp. 21AC1]MDV3129576.1 hypothetical protein [Mycobacterium sp. 21AC1]